MLAIKSPVSRIIHFCGIRIICAAFAYTLNSDFMAETLAFSKTADRKIIYDEIIPQIELLVSGETDVIANLANIAAVLKEAVGFFWVGFYLAKDGQLVLGPFQGPVACTRINIDEGVCGRAFSTRQTVVVPNVDEFPGHIACASASRSEIVVPILDAAGTVFGVLDVDSDRLDDFSETDSVALETIVKIIERFI
jgi:L-methionine (R)-S-oxide reductase